MESSRPSIVGTEKDSFVHQVDPSALRFILANCTDPQRADEFDDWYNRYGASLTRAGFFRNVVRYEANDANPRHATLYDIDSPYSGLAWPMTRSHPAKLGAPSPLLDVVLRATYERIAPRVPLVLDRPEKFVTFVLSDCTAPESIREVDEYFERSLNVAGAFNASRYALIEGQPEPPHYLEVYESDAPLAADALRMDRRPKSLVTRFHGAFEYRWSHPK